MKAPSSPLSPLLIPESLLARNVAYNILGQGLPLLLALFAIPGLVHHLGIQRFGLLNAAWIALAWFTLLDFGLGRTLTLLTAEKGAAQKTDDLPPLLWTAVLLAALAGFLGSALLLAALPRVVEELLKIPAPQRSEALEAFGVLALSLPLVLVIQVLQGALEGCQRYDLSNIGRLLLGCFTFLGPLLALAFSPRLSLAFATLVAGRLVTCAYYLLGLLRHEPLFRRHFQVKLKLAKVLLGFGGWLTVSNVFAMVITYLDRFLIGALLPLSALAYYATPYDLVTRQLLIPNAVAGVMLPSFAASLVVDRHYAGRLFRQSLKYAFLLLFPLALVIVTLAGEGLYWWLGAEFAGHSTRVLQILAMGVLINGLAYLPFVLIQGAGRPDLIAKLLLLQFPLYGLLLWLLLNSLGIVGAALAFTLRVGVDAAILFWVAKVLLRLDDLPKGRLILTAAAVSLALLSAMFLGHLLLKCLFLIAVLAGFGIFTWECLLSASERRWVRDNCLK